MSKLKISATLDDNQKVIELDRKNISYNDLRSKLLAKYKIGAATLRFVTAGGDYIDISSDQHLQRVIQEVTNSRQKQIDVKVLAGGQTSAQSSPAPAQASQPASNYSSPAPSSPSTTTGSSGASSYRQFTRTGSSTPSTPTNTAPKSANSSAPSTSTRGDYELIIWKLPADKGSNLDKPKIGHQATYDSFTFTPQASKYDTEVRVVLVDGKKLAFECTYSFPDTSYGGQVGTRTVTATQSFGLPVDVAPANVEVIGHSIKINIRS